MIGIILASHGKLASGVRHSASMVFGDQPSSADVSLMPGEGPEDFRRKLLDAIDSLDERREVLILVDLWGGTPFNQASLLLEEHDTWALVTGMNLPMVIEAYAMRSSVPTAFELADCLQARGREWMRVKPEFLTREPDPADPPVSAPATKANEILPRGTVLGDGRVDIAWTRIDSRLLHGQVAMAWSKQIQPTRIIVVSDGVSHDALRKSLITEAAPPGIRANVIPISKMIEIAHDPRFGSQRVLLLFENPADVLRCVEGGVPIRHVNIGSMAHSAGKTLLNDAVSVDAQDVQALSALRDHGCTFGVQKVPTDKSQDIWGLISRSGLSTTTDSTQS
ncbi:PTS sugar transporter subunit IIB [uncultured Parolsenella sp.]|uniref:PTS sugar transporter subunit IIB n=1 Tax=uncultured Parolsenella sp. TaxID=2083008 RepID=UPI0027D95964|nr:PTS sugar transporter subunit IIB [uncultured Parolsenella sp.]